MKNKSRTSNIALLTIIALFIIFGLMYINSKSFNKNSIAAVSNSLTIKEELEASSASDIVFYTDNIILEIQGSVIRAKKVNGESAWSLNFGKKIKIIKAAGDSIVIVDEIGNLNSLSKLGKLQWDYKLTDELQDIYCDDNGYVLVEYKGSAGSKIETFNNKGAKIGSTVLENAYILSFASGKGDTYTISALDVTTDKVKSKLITYDNKGSMLWAKDFEGELIPYVKYIKNNNILAVSGNKLIKFKSDGSTADDVKIQGQLERIAANEGMIAIITNEKGKRHCISMDANFRKQGDVELEIIPEGIFVYKNNYTLYNKGNVLIGNINGSIKAAYKSISDIVAVYMTSEADIYIVSNRKLQHLGYAE